MHHVTTVGIQNSSPLWTILLLVICAHLNTYHVVNCDLSIHDENTNQLIFQTASDFVQTSKCGSLYHKQKAHLVLSEPLYTCEDDVIPPPTPALEYYFSALKDKFALLADLVFGVDLAGQVQDDVPWVLIAGMELDGACNLPRKLQQFADAGYSAVLLASDINGTQFLKILNASMSLEDKQETFLDIHLINHWDIRVLSKYAYPVSSSFTIDIPPRKGAATCRDFYSKTKLHWQKKLIVDGINEWSNGLIDQIWNWIYQRIKIDSRLLSILGYGAAAMVLLAPAIGSFYLAKLDRESRAREEFLRQKQYDFYYQQRSRQSEDPPPTPPPRKPSRSGTASDKVRKHRENLGMSREEKLITANVMSAYRRKALVVHPDKHPEHLKKQQEKIFKQLVESKKFLLSICVDAKHEE